MRRLAPLLLAALLAAAMPHARGALASPLDAIVPDSTVPAVDRVRLAEAFRLAEQLGDSVWPGWSRAPFAVLLVTPDREFLIRHPSPPAGFARIGYDSLLRSDVLARPRMFPTRFLATFPIGGPLPVIVVGEAEHTGKSTTGWILSVLHEHFHQLQFSRPGYYAGLDSLGLARGDTTGMWALNYAFPYDSLVVRARFDSLTRALGAAVAVGGTVGKREAGAALAARAALDRVLTRDDARYLNFQLWQEGVARYTEYRLAALAAERFVPAASIRALPDFQPWAEARDSVRRAIVRGTRGARLEVARREVAYPVGAALALVLDRVRPSWKADYFTAMFTIPISR